MSFERFIQLWSYEGNTDPVQEDDFFELEANLGWKFPADYRDAVLKYGLPQMTIELLHSIVEEDLDLREVSEFIHPREILKDTLSWREAGLPDHFIAFAFDSSGSLFCFDLRKTGEPGREVFYYDHDFNIIEADADSFNDWIARFCEVTPHPDWREE